MSSPAQPSPIPPSPIPLSLDAAPARLAARAVARLVDGVLLALVGGVVLFLTLSPVRSGLLQGALASLLSAALYLGYFTALESRDGRTFGKTVMKLRVVGPDGGVPTLEQALRRNSWVALGAAGVVPLVGAVVGGLAQLAAAITIAVGIGNDAVTRRGWHDRLADTYVVTDD